MAVALRSSAPPPALALSDRLGLGRFHGGAGGSSHRSAGPLPLIYSGSLSFKRLCISGRATISLSERRRRSGIIACAGPTENQPESPSPPEPSSKAPFGYTRKDVLLIGIGVLVLGVGLKSGLEYFGVDSLRAGNFVQLIVVLGMTVGWISTYMFRVASKDMTYAQQLRDYEVKVMEKRLESLSEAEVVALMEQVEEEKRQLARREKPSSSS